MRRALVILAAAAMALAVLPPASACHFGGVGCGDPEEQPFDPQPFGSVEDNRTSAHSDSVTGYTQEEHEQFVIETITDLPAEFGVDLDAPAFGEKIADIEIDVDTDVGPVTVTGRIEDDNDPSTGWPQGGVWRWLVTIETSDGPKTTHAFADQNAPDGHLHIEVPVSEELRAQAELFNASVRRVETRTFGTVAAGPFLTNPSDPGTYTTRVELHAWDANGDGTFATKVGFIDTVIEARVPAAVDLQPEAATVRVGNAHTLTATVLDQAGEALAGAGVAFDVAGANPTSGSGTTDANGEATFSYTGTAQGDDTVTATATKNGQSASEAASVRWSEPSSVTLSPETATRGTGEDHTLTATVRDQDGNPMGDVSVTFTRDGANPGTASAVTDLDGQATHTYTGTNDGTDTVTVTVASSTLAASATVEWYTPVVADLSLSPATATRNVGQQHTMTATVTDQKGLPMQGVTVSFAVASGPHAGVSGSAGTDADGGASFSYTGEAAGDDVIEASADGASATATVSWEARSPTTLERSVTHDNQPFAFAYQERSTGTAAARVLDQDGLPLPGIEVSFTITSGPNATGEFDRTIVTDAEGRAVLTYSGTIANGEGTDTIEARVVGTALSGTGTIRWHIHPCDDPEATHGDTFVGGSEDVHTTVNGEETWVHVCNE